jgi:hypothetical protein
MNQGFGAPKKPNYQLYGVLALIVCLCCCSSSMMSYYRVSIRPSGNMLQGYTGGGGIRGDPRGRPKQTRAQCRAYARERGYAGTGHRTDAHPSAAYRNTCFFYSNPNAKSGWQGNPADKAHNVGCTDPGKSWGSC